VEYCHKNNIIVEAYCPLVRNQKATDPTLSSIAEKHGTSTPQVLVRYCLEKNWVPLPKSDNPKRIVSNADVYRLQLDKEDMAKLDDRPQEPALVVAVDNNAT
jgi:diketogulonate reductase-like aldo/keto reductase